MKNKISIPGSAACTAFLLAAICFISITSCTKPYIVTSASTGTFYFHIHTDIDTTEVDDTTKLYRDATGRHFGLSVAQFFIYNVVIHNVNGSAYTIPNAYILKSIDSEQYIIGTAPTGTYDAVTFNVGLVGAPNNLQPSAFTPTSAYVPVSTMWYGNISQGYMFMKLQGVADTTAAQNGSGLVHFSYEIGSLQSVGGPNLNLKTVTMPTRTGAFAPYILTAGGAQYIHIIADYGKLLSVVNFNTQDTTDTYTTNITLSTTIADNIPNMFHYEE